MYQIGLRAWTINRLAAVILGKCKWVEDYSGFEPEWLLTEIGKWRKRGYERKEQEIMWAFSAKMTPNAGFQRYLNRKELSLLSKTSLKLLLWLSLNISLYSEKYVLSCSFTLGSLSKPLIIASGPTRMLWTLHSCPDGYPEWHCCLQSGRRRAWGLRPVFPQLCDSLFRKQHVLCWESHKVWAFPAPGSNWTQN